ncbi:MAG: SpoIIE family protein phosphatase [Atopobiaceae bacterium]|nr:SpoIIE family protein phosphatase [Atopobiaceae bacterium]
MQTIGGQNNEQRRGLGTQTIPGTLARLLSLTTDAVFVFDESGCIVLANDQAARLFRATAIDLQGTYICDYVRPLDGEACSDGVLPFPLDGSLVERTAIMADGTVVLLGMRCELISAPGVNYLFVAHSLDDDHQQQLEHERLVTELRRANQRLSGTLKIVISTINSPDVSALFSDVLEELSDAMDASGTLMYMAEGSGFRLRGSTTSLKNMNLPKLLPARDGVVGQAVRAGNALRMTVLPPTREQLRKGKLTERELIDESSLERLKIPSNQLPPFESFLCAPIWYGEHVIAVIELGWIHAHVTRPDDVRLLDAVGQYLSVQLATAISTMRTQRMARLETMVRDIRDVMRSITGTDGLRFEYVFSRLAEELGAQSVTVRESDAKHLFVASLDNGKEFEFEAPTDRATDTSEADAGVALIQLGQPVSEQLQEHGLPGEGALVDLGVTSGQRYCTLLLRDEGDGFEQYEVDLMLRVCDEVRIAIEGEEARAHDSHISQALQTGMKSVLQDVEGIEARGLYSSATAAALVGGDFYDLVRLPDHKACVIIGDVSGKGVEAASVSAAVRAALEAYSWEGLTPARMVRSLNDFLLGFARLETFATLFVGICDLKASKLIYCSAGHPPALLFQSQTGEIEMLGVQSGAVGAFKEMTYIDGQVDLHESDMLVLYTDGVIEARNEQGGFFGEAALRETVLAETQSGFDGLLERILDTIDIFTGRKLEDDVAMVALRFDALGDSLD